MSALAIAKACLQAYVDKDRAAAERLIAPQFSFTSPLDDHIDRDAYFERCWPNSEGMTSATVVHSAESGDCVFIVYEVQTEKKCFRNCEMHVVHDGQLAEVEVYFGWDLPHPAALKPKIEHRPGQPYVGVRVVMPMEDFQGRIPAMTAEAFERASALGLPPSGPAFLRYHVIDMPKRMDVELGVPVEAAQADLALPAGRYAVLTYEGVKSGVQANKKLIAWIEEQGESVVSHPSAHGEVFKSRFETYLTDAAAEPNSDRWAIEVAIKLRDRSSR